MGEKRCGMTKQNEKISLFERGRGERGGRGGGGGGGVYGVVALMKLSCQHVVYFRWWKRRN